MTTFLKQTFATIYKSGRSMRCKLQPSVLILFLLVPTVSTETNLQNENRAVDSKFKSFPTDAREISYFQRLVIG